MSRPTASHGRLARLAVGRHRSHRAVRIRLTFLYGGLFLLSGAALMAITYVLLGHAGFVFTLQPGSSSRPPPDRDAVVTRRGPVSGGFPGPGTTTHPSAATVAHWRGVARCMRARGVAGFPDPTTSVPSNLSDVAEVSDRDGVILAIPATIDTQSSAFTQAATACGLMPDDTTLSAADSRRRRQVRQLLLIQSGIALAGMSLLSLGLGWVMAGRVLRPLADAYHAQRQFVANASHELRAPLTRLRALSEVALAGSGSDEASLRRAHERVLASEQDLEKLIDALLALARGQAGLERRVHVDLAALTSEAMVACEPALAGLDLDIRATLEPAPTAGDPRLLGRLIANLIDNAIRHNTPGGYVEIMTGTRDRHAILVIANTGGQIAPEQLQRLFQPFQRLGDARTRHDTGHGLGLAIVEAIANAHHAELGAGARPEGGLTIEISFPPATRGGSRPVIAPAPARPASRRAIGDPDAPA